MDKNISPEEIESILYNIDFSHGHKSAVWEKVLSRLNPDAALNIDELDDVAGGRHNPEHNNGLDGKGKL